MALAHAPDAKALDPQRWKALAVVLIAGFMTLLDISIVNVGIPAISADLHATSSEIEFVIAGYALAYAVTLITGGRLGDTFGRKRLFIIGVTGFTVASAFCGLAQSGTMLVFSRVAQGLLAALMYPQILSIIQVNFGPRERPKAFGMMGGTIGLASITGPLLGGLLIQGNLFNLSWRPIFLVNVPIGIAAVVCAFVFMHESTSPSAPRLDIPGMLIAALAFFLLSYPLVEGRQEGWPLWIFAMLGSSVVALALFAVYLRWRAAAKGSPLVEPSLFRDRAFVIGMLVTVCFMAGVPAFFLTFSIALQVGHGFSPLETGLTTMPFAIASAMASFASARVASRLGTKILALGAFLLICGMLGVIVILQLMPDNDFRGYAFIPALTVAGLGLGCFIAPLINIVLGGIHDTHAGSASGVLNTVQQLGGALGVAMVGVIFFGVLGGHADQVSADRTPAFQQALQRPNVPGLPVPLVASGVTSCFHDRANATDLSADPASCQQLAAAAAAHPTPQGAAVGAVIQAEALNRVADDFTYSLQRALLFNIGAWLLTLLLVFLLPRPSRAAQAGYSAGAH